MTSTSNTTFENQNYLLGEQLLGDGTTTVAQKRVSCQTIVFLVFSLIVLVALMVFFF